MTRPPATRWTVYAICDPRTGLPFYIGQTNDLARRQRQHLENYRPRSYRSQHIKALLDAGLVPTFRTLHTATTKAEALALEAAEIERHARSRLLLKQQKAQHFIQKRHRQESARTKPDTDPDPIKELAR